MLTKSQVNLETTQTIIENQDQAKVSLLSREDILGEMYYVGGLGYHAQLISLNFLSALKQNGAHQLAYGYGSYGYEPNLNTFFGITRGVNKGIIAFNMRHAAVTHSETGIQEKNANMMFQNGLVSSMLEHSIPEQMFNDQDNSIDAFSAIKAIQLGAQQGQRIYQLDRNNIESLSAISIDADARAEIVASINIGSKVIVHQNPIQVPGWRGSGYILLDEETGVGSYKISGGANGGFSDLDEILASILSVFSLNLFIEALANIADILAKSGLFALANVVFSIITNIKKIQDCDSDALFAFGAIFILGTLIASFLLAASVLGGGLGILIGVMIISAIQATNISLFADALANSDECKPQV